MARLPCQLIAGAIAAGGGVTGAAGSNQNMGCAVGFAIRGAHANTAAILNQQLLGAAMHKFGVGGIAAQGGQHIGGTVALREHPAAAFRFERHAKGFKQFHSACRRECVQRGVQKARVMAHIVQKLAHITIIGHIAAALAGNQQLLAGAFGVVFHHGGGQPPCAGGTGGHQARRTAANNQQIRHSVMTPLLR